MKSRKSAIKTDLFAADLHHQKLDQLGDPLLRIGACIDFTALTAQMDSAAPQPVSEPPQVRWRVFISPSSGPVGLFQ
ncbi:hypothetical protein DLNHIDIE_03068 [Acidithiobacillus thiooxidans ATCC 19377]|uniref:Uncharacterized protein n=1 Tax=Acidithiobacillus thiooxidans ATCC 19377 TaxID=637390 RepID=A0A543Q012_ACITH|nr:hypothetical protein DLNHIDIE_03068 [Acidithiobacillus thiooxidans ATCC 19377]